MANDDPERDDLAALVVRHLEGTLDEKGRERLSAVLRGSEARRGEFVRLSIQARLLAVRLGPHASLRPEPEPGEDPEGVGGFGARPGRARPRRPVLSSILSIAASLLLVGLLAMTAFASRKDEVARLARAIDCRWEGTAPAPGDPLGRRERLRLRSGIAGIAFGDGARILLRGPVALELTGEDELRLDRGRIIASLPGDDATFTVRTPLATITDAGTELGIDVDRVGATEVHVFEGRVEVEVPSPRGASSRRRVEEREAIRIGAGGEIEDVEPDPERFGRGLGSGRAEKKRLIEESFDEDDLSPELWRTAVPRRNGRIGVSDGFLTLANRAYLVTAREYDPTELGGLRITGTWRFESYGAGEGGFDLLNVLTRSDPRPDPDYYHEARSGILFRLDTRDSRPSILVRGRDLRTTKPVAVGSLSVREGALYRFEVMDVGTDLSLTVTEVDDPTNTASVTATVSRDESSRNHIVFYNREKSSAEHVARLDDIAIACGIAGTTEDTETREAGTTEVTEEDAGEDTE